MFDVKTTVRNGLNFRPYVSYVMYDGKAIWMEFGFTRAHSSGKCWELIQAFKQVVSHE